MYEPDEARLWLYSRSRLVGGQRPVDLISKGNIDPVLQIIALLKDRAHLLRPVTAEVTGRGGWWWAASEGQVAGEAIHPLDALALGVPKVPHLLTELIQEIT